MEHISHAADSSGLVVELGFAEKVDSWKLRSKFFPSKLGGKPAWLRLKPLPSPAELKCASCCTPLVFVLQVYAPIDNQADAFHRTLFLFACEACVDRKRSLSDFSGHRTATTGKSTAVAPSLVVFRSQLGISNDFYPREPPDEVELNSEHPSAADFQPLCCVCGGPGAQRCSACLVRNYCSREHQTLDWKKGHKMTCVKLCDSGTGYNHSVVCATSEDSSSENVAVVLGGVSPAVEQRTDQKARHSQLNNGETSLDISSFSDSSDACSRGSDGQSSNTIHSTASTVANKVEIKNKRQVNSDAAEQAADHSNCQQALLTFSESAIAHPTSVLGQKSAFSSEIINADSNGSRLQLEALCPAHFVSGVTKQPHDGASFVHSSSDTHCKRRDGNDNDEHYSTESLNVFCGGDLSQLKINWGSPHTVASSTPVVQNPSQNPSSLSPLRPSSANTSSGSATALQVPGRSKYTAGRVISQPNKCASNAMSRKSCEQRATVNYVHKGIFPEFTIETETEEIQQEIDREDTREDLEKFLRTCKKGSMASSKDMAQCRENDLKAIEDFSRSFNDRAFKQFKKIVDHYPEQILRYCRGGSPLWVSRHNIPHNIPPCELCGSPRQFEFQVMPHVLNLIKSDLLDWGTLAIYTCKKSCNSSDYVKEYVYRQDFSL